MEANDAASICRLAGFFLHESEGLQQDHAKAMSLYNRAAALSFSKAHCFLGNHYYEGGNLKKAKYHGRGYRRT